MKLQLSLLALLAAGYGATRAAPGLTNAASTNPILMTNLASNLQRRLPVSDSEALEAAAKNP
jgi:hypothetical protein